MGEHFFSCSADFFSVKTLLPYSYIKTEEKMELSFSECFMVLF